MRNVFAAEITHLAETDARLLLLSGDIGNKLFEDFKRVAPGRFINCGIAEANMMGMAAGLALSGFRPVVYTITPFATTRCFEQIRVDVCYHQAPVVIVGTGSGLSYAELGPTHHSLEDIAILRTLPGMVVLCPADGEELRPALHAALAQQQPVYIRLGKKGEPRVHDQPPVFDIGKALVLRQGRDVCLLGTGNSVRIVMDAANLLEAQGIYATVVSFHTVKPLDIECLERLFGQHRLVALVEEHARIGGFAGAVSEWLAQRGGTLPRFLSFGVGDAFVPYIGSQQYLRTRLGLDASQIASAVLAGLA